MDQPEWHDLGPLVAVLDYCWAGDEPLNFIKAVQMSFESGSVLFKGCGDDTIEVRSPAPVMGPNDDRMSLRTRNRSEADPWRWAVGHGVRWGRVMTNHHGYQLEFGIGTSESAVGRSIELVVAASHLFVGTASFE